MVRNRESASERSCETRDSPTPMTGADFCERHLFLEVQRQDLPLALGQLLDGARQVFAQLLAFELRRGAFTGIDAQLRWLRPSSDALSSDRTAPISRVRSCSITLSYSASESDSSAAMSVSSGSRPSFRRAVAMAASTSRRSRRSGPWRPVEIAQRVEHRALHAAPGKGVERHAERRLVAAAASIRPSTPTLISRRLSTCDGRRCASRCASVLTSRRAPSPADRVPRWPVRLRA
jgi:hypothetical protein